MVTLTGRGSPREAGLAISAARNRVWEAYHSIERYSSASGVCRRRQILEHFADPEGGSGVGRCCDVCDPDEELREALEGHSLSLSRTASRRGGRTYRSQGVALAVDAGEPPVDDAEFDALRAWRLERAEGKPAYTVATDSALRGILRRRPGRISEVVEVQGDRELLL